MKRLIETRPQTPAFPLAALRIERIMADSFAHDWRAVKHHEAYKKRMRRIQQEAIRSNRAAEQRGEYMLDAQGRVM